MGEAGRPRWLWGWMREGRRLAEGETGGSFTRVTAPPDTPWVRPQEQTDWYVNSSSSTNYKKNEL